MRLTLVLPFPNRTGGVRLVLQFANALQDAGHRVCVAYPRRPYRFHHSRREWRKEFRETKRAPVLVPWFPLRAPLLRAPQIRSRHLPDADVVVATSWPTAFDVSGLAPRKGRRLQLVMHHEAGTGPAARIAEVYRLPLLRIALSRAVQSQLNDEFGCAVDDIVPAGIDPAVFHPDGQASSAAVLMLVHPAPRKGAREGLDALALLAGRRPDLRVLLCGTVRPAGLPERFPFLLHPNDATLRRLYSTAAVFLYPSLYEGFGLPPLEAMACGCPVVATRVGAVSEYARDGHNALLVSPGDIGGMAGRLGEILDRPGLRRRLIEAGLETAAAWTIERAARRFAEVLKTAM